MQSNMFCLPSSLWVKWSGQIWWIGDRSFLLYTLPSQSSQVSITRPAVSTDEWLRKNCPARFQGSGYPFCLADSVCLLAWTPKIIRRQAVWQIGQSLKSSWLVQWSNSWRILCMLPGSLGTAVVDPLLNAYAHTRTHMRAREANWRHTFQCVLLAEGRLVPAVASMSGQHTLWEGNKGVNVLHRCVRRSFWQHFAIKWKIVRRKKWPEDVHARSNQSRVQSLTKQWGLVFKFCLGSGLQSHLSSHRQLTTRGLGHRRGAWIALIATPSAHFTIKCGVWGFPTNGFEIIVCSCGFKGFNGSADVGWTPFKNCIWPVTVAGQQLSHALRHRKYVFVNWDHDQK